MMDRKELKKQAFTVPGTASRSIPLRAVPFDTALSLMDENEKLEKITEAALEGHDQMEDELTALRTERDKLKERVEELERGRYWGWYGH
jgi:hypothetical protein